MILSFFTGNWKVQFIVQHFRMYACMYICMHVCIHPSIYLFMELSLSRQVLLFSLSGKFPDKAADALLIVRLRIEWAGNGVPFYLWMSRLITGSIRTVKDNINISPWSDCLTFECVDEILRRRGWCVGEAETKQPTRYPVWHLHRQEHWPHLLPSGEYWLWGPAFWW